MAAPRHSDEFLLDCLRQAAAVCGEPLSGICYQELAYRQWPAYNTVVRRLGGWQEACRRAGVKTNPSRGSYPNTITQEQCWEAIRACASALGHSPSYAQYVAWADGQAVPKGPTVRSKHQGSWRLAVAKALDDVVTPGYGGYSYSP